MKTINKYKYIIFISLIFIYPLIIIIGDYFLIYNIISKIKYFYIIIIPLLIITLTNKFSDTKKNNYSFSTNKLVINIIILILALACCVYMICMICHFINKAAINGFETNTIRSLFTTNKLLSYLIAFFWFLFIIFSTNSNIYFKCCYFIFAGLYAGSYDLIYQLSSIDYKMPITNSIIRAIYFPCFLMVFIGIICSVSFYCYVKKLR